MLNFFKQKSEKPKSLGQLGEELAQGEYKSRGYTVIAANFFNKKGLRKGEVDVIAIDADKKHIVFVEVKTRKDHDSMFGTGMEAVNYFKQRKLLAAVKVFLLQNPKYALLQPRIDVCEIILNLDNTVKSVTIITNAVEDTQ